MAGEKKGFLQGILRGIPLFRKAKDADYPNEGPVPTYSGQLKVKGMPLGGMMFPHRIKYRGMLDLDKLYRVMAGWFKEKRFELHENLFKSKPPEWEVRLMGERKETAFVKNIIDVHVHMWGTYNIDAIVNGRKKKMANVRVISRIDGDIQRPYADIFEEPRWTATGFECRILKLFQNWFYRRETEGIYWDKLYYELYDLHGAIKAHLGMGAR